MPSTFPPEHLATHQAEFIEGKLEAYLCILVHQMDMHGETKSMENGSKVNLTDSCTLPFI